jgi:hypothetical protein
MAGLLLARSAARIVARLGLLAGLLLARSAARIVARRG